MDTASLIGLLTSVDVMSLKPTLFGIEDLINDLFTTITGSVNTGAGGIAAIGYAIQGALGSIGAA